MKRAVLLALLGLALPALAGEFDYRLTAREVVPGVHVFLGRSEDFSPANGGNIVNAGFIVTPAGAIVVDTGSSRRYGEQMRRVVETVTGGPVLQVFNTHLHPDHFLGNQAYAGVPIAALAATRQEIASSGDGFAANLYRLTGNWMQGTEVLVPDQTVSPGTLVLGGHRLRLLALAGHSGADLAIYDESSGVLFAGDLVFNGRAPTTPHADPAQWLASLTQLEAITREPGFRALVPGHGAVSHDAAPIRQTRDWLVWLTRTLAQAAARGLDMSEALELPLPPEFATLAVASAEFRRSVWHLYPRLEQEALGHAH